MWICCRSRSRERCRTGSEKASLPGLPRSPIGGLEAGRRDENAVIAFTKAVELKKLEFDAAQGKEGKKRIVLEVRGLWRGLLQDSRAS